MTEMPSGLTVDVTQAAEGPIVTPRGDLDLATAGDLVDRASALLNAAKATLTVDMSAVDFCDSAGINALVKLRNECDDHGWVLVVANPQPHVRQVFKLSGLTEFLAVSPS